MVKAAGTRNPELARGITKYGRSKSFSRSGKYLFVTKGDKNGTTKKEVSADTKVASRFYEADDVKKPLPSRKRIQHQTKLRSSITPGTVLIILSGRFRGKRVVFLKQLEKSGLLLVSGPYKVNGVPLRRLNQAYVIATSTKVDISGVSIPEHINDAYFARVGGPKPKEGEDEFYASQSAPVNADWLAKRKADQKTVDTALVKLIKAEPALPHYLNAKFSLTNGQAPHAMKF